MKAFSLIGECAEKSELVRRLVVEQTGRGLRVSTIKRVSDAVDLERTSVGTGRQKCRWRSFDRPARRMLTTNRTD
jgi:molybdopterin-guanine dinucleotide biosynthesis adapter protein